MYMFYFKNMLAEKAIKIFPKQHAANIFPAHGGGSKGLTTIEAKCSSSI